MKRLSEYILEELDDNLFWLIDKWFERNETQKEEFLSIVTYFLNDNLIDKNKLQELLLGTSLNGQLKEFVNFIENNICIQDDIDYIEHFRNIIKQVTYRQKTKGVH